MNGFSASFFFFFFFEMLKYVVRSIWINVETTVSFATFKPLIIIINYIYECRKISISRFLFIVTEFNEQMVINLHSDQTSNQSLNFRFNSVDESISISQNRGHLTLFFNARNFQWRFLWDEVALQTFNLHSNALRNFFPSFSTIFCWLFHGKQNYREQTLFRPTFFSSSFRFFVLSLFVWIIRLLDQKCQHFNDDIWIKMQSNRTHVQQNSLNADAQAHCSFLT